MPTLATLGRLLVRAGRLATRRSEGRGRRTTRGASGHDGTLTAPGVGRYPGDFTGVVRPVYAPDPDGDPDPGEIVWTWVPFEDDPSQGKDRPVLVVARQLDLRHRSFLQCEFTVALEDGCQHLICHRNPPD